MGMRKSRGGSGARVAALAGATCVGLAVSLSTISAAVASASPAGHIATSCDKWLGGSGSFSDAADWSTGVVPTDGINACITAAGTYTVTVLGNQAVQNLTLGGSSGTQTLLLLGTPQTQTASAEGASLSIYGTTGTIGAHGVVDLDETGTTSASDVVFYGGTVTNNGTFEETGVAGSTSATDAVDSNLTNTKSGTVTISYPDAEQYNATTITNNGSFTITSTGNLAVVDASSFTDSGGTLVVDGTYAQTGGTFTQSGGKATGTTLSLTGATLDDSSGAAKFDLYDNSSFNGNIESNQTVTLVGTPTTGITLDLPSSGITNDGTLTLDETGTTSASDIELYGGTVTNNGTFDATGVTGGTTVEEAIATNLTNTASGKVTISDADVEQPDDTTTTNDGVFSVTNGGGITLAGSSVYSQGSTGTFGATVDAHTGAFGLSGGTDTLDGTLAIDTVGKPAVGTVYNMIASAASITGTFSTISSGSDTYDVAYPTTSVTATFEGS
jgi:hypothetical protein